MTIAELNNDFEARHHILDTVGKLRDWLNLFSPDTKIMIAGSIVDIGWVNFEALNEKQIETTDDISAINTSAS